MPMPKNYVVEMFMDRIAASKTYMRENYTDRKPLEYYEQGAKYVRKMLHADTRELLETLLHMLAERGEEVTFAYIRKEVLNKR